MEDFCQAVSLVFACHGKCLRAIADSHDLHYQGLSVAARLACRRGHISKGMRNKLEQVDMAYNIVRHITRASAMQLLNDLQTSLGAKEVVTQPSMLHLQQPLGGSGQKTSKDEKSEFVGEPLNEKHKGEDDPNDEQYVRQMAAEPSTAERAADTMVEEQSEEKVGEREEQCFNGTQMDDVLPKEKEDKRAHLECTCTEKSREGHFDLMVRAHRQAARLADKVPKRKAKVADMDEEYNIVVVELIEQQTDDFKKCMRTLQKDMRRLELQKKREKFEKKPPKFVDKL